MRLNDVWGYGQLFGYSAIDGLNRYDRDFIGTLTPEKIGVRFELRPYWVKLLFDIKGEITFSAVMSDFIEAKTVEGDFFITFFNNDTLVGYSPVSPMLIGENGLTEKTVAGVKVYNSDGDYFGVSCVFEGGLYKFCIVHGFTEKDVLKSSVLTDNKVQELKAKRYAYYENMPKCKDLRYEKLYYKALAINKVNVKSPEGNIKHVWTTPDRVPHKKMWLWDSVFHALAIVTYNPELAKSALLAVLSQQREDGLIPHMMSPVGSSDVTQPQVLSWGVWEVYKKTGDKDFLAKCVSALDGYLTWDMKNRDKNGNGLLEWYTEPDDIHCKCGESGLDDSPRFDFDQEMDCIDFSTFMCSDALYLSKIYAELGDDKNADKWQKISDSVKEKINAYLWDEVDGVYYDRLFDGTLSKILTPVSFLPMAVGISTKEQVAKMVKVLTNESLLWAKVPFSSVSQQDPTYSTDMWRGGVWLNINYLIMKGLINYGYGDLAETVREKTLATVLKWYEKTGTVFEFYDSQDKTVPYLCDRKGPCPNPPDLRKKVHSIADYNWSACFTILMIQKEYYL